MNKKLLSVLLAAVMILSLIPMTVFAETPEPAEEVYRPYGLTLTTDTIIFKEDVNVSDYVTRWDMFILAGNSGDTAPIRVDINEFDAEGFKLYEGYCIKANGSSEVAEHPGATFKKLDDDTFEITIIPSKINAVKFLGEGNPYIWLVVAPCDAYNRLDQSKGTSGHYDVYNSTVCLGKFGTMENFKTVTTAAHTHGSVTFEAWNDAAKLPDTAGNYYLDTDVTLNATWYVPTGETNLCLNGHVVKPADGKTGNVINIPTGATLKLYDCGETVHNGYTDADGLWHLGTGEGTAKNITGGVITGGNPEGSGGGLYVYGTFVMDGGTIAGNTAANSGGGFYSNGGTVTIYDGEVSGNTATNSGGGIYSSKGSLTIYNATVSGNKANNYGGGIYIDGGTALIKDGVINGNTALGNGGGVQVAGGGTLTMESGIISGNISNTASGLRIGDTVKVYLTAGEGKTISITDNIADSAEAGVAAWGETHLSGKIIVKDNICTNTYGDGINSPVNFATNKPVYIDGALTGSEIYITHEDKTAKEHDTGVLTSGFTAQNNGAKLGDFFHYEGPDSFDMALNDDGELAAISHVHKFVKVSGKAPTESEDGWKDYYECTCGAYSADKAGKDPIDDIDAWKSGDGFLPKTLNAVDYDGMPVEPGPETYEVKEDGIHVYGDGIIFSGKSNKPFIIENAFQSLNCKDLVINSDLIIEGLAGGVQIVLNNTTVNGDVVAKKASPEDELYLSVAFMGDNTIAGKVDSEGSVTIYGDSDATLSVKNIKTGTMLYAENMRIENMDGEYVFGETTTADPADELAPIVFTVKQYVYFPTADEYVINNGEPFKANEEIEFDLPIVRNENGEVIDPQPELEAAFYVYGEDYSMTLLDGVPTEEGDYCVWFNVSDNDSVYCGSSMYDFSIAAGEPAHEHNLVKQNGKAATKDAAGYKDYYKCDCGKCFEDATGKVEITDLKKWQAEGGSGYIAKLTDSDPDSKIEKTPDTGDSFNAVLWSVVFVLAVAVLGVCIDIDKKKIRVK